MATMPMHMILEMVTMLMRQNDWIKLWGNIPMQMIYETMGNHTHKTEPLDEEGNHARKQN